MADPIGIVNDCVGRHVGYVESTLGQQVGYLLHYKRNLQDLRTKVGELNVDKDTMRERVRAAEDKGEMIHGNVQDWLKKVDEITDKANDLLKDKRQSTTEEANYPLTDEGQPKTKCVQGFCPNPILRRRRSKESLEFKDEVIELINKGRQLSNISCAPPKNLQTEVDKLSLAKATVAEKVTAAAAKGEKIHVNVQDWLKKVTEITKETEEFLKDEIQSTEEPNDSSSHRSKKSLELLQVVTKLYDTGVFSDVSFVVPANDRCLESAEDYQKLDSRAVTVEKIMDELRSANSADVILVYGIGGVGKTTLAEEVLRQAKKEKLFDDLVMVRDVKKPNLEAIQKVMADKLGLDLSKIQTNDGRADNICHRIKEEKTDEESKQDKKTDEESKQDKKTDEESKQDKKTLVILDDVWEEIGFQAVGLPHIKTCRILLTSRTSKLLSKEKIKQKPFQLGVLGEEETWLLFEKTAGNVVDDPSIRPIATQVANKCGGLPLLVVTVASSLRDKTEEPIWSNALRSLEEFDKEEELTKKAYLGLEWSYTQLNENLKPLCLLCGTIVEGNSISLTNLLKYGMGLGILKKTKNVKQARDLLYTQVRNLKDSSLLLDGDDDTCVRMHDLVHLVVNQIASRDHHVLVQDGTDDVLKEWTTENLLRCSKMSLPCCNIATLPNVPWECPKLEMFHLHNKDDDDLKMFHLHKKDEDDYDDLKMFHLHKKDEDEDDDDDDEDDDMPSNFFKEMKNLKVLGLNNLPPISLPSNLQCLTNLQTLCLDGCKFKDIAQVGELTSLQILSIVKSKVKQLPKEIGQLTRLRLLDLSDCDRLEVISPGVISNLTSLEDLRMRNSFYYWQGTEGVFLRPKTKKVVFRETSNNASLSELKKLSKLSALEIRIRDADILPPNFFSDNLLEMERYQIFVGDAWERDRMYETALNTLKLQLTSRNEFDQGLKMLLKKCDVLSLNGVRFPILETIWHGQLAPGSFGRLREVYVGHCNSLTSIFSASMATRCLQQLQKLEVDSCHAMETIVAKEEGRLESTTPQEFVFPKVKSLTFSYMSTLRSFYPGLHAFKCPLLEDMTFKSCSKLEFLAAELSIIQERQYVQTKQPFFLINQEVTFNYLTTLSKKNYLTTLSMRYCDDLKCLFSSSVAQNFKKLKHLEISHCKIMEQIISTTKQDEEHNMFGELKSLRLAYLPNLAGFCTGKSIEFPLLEELYISECIELGAFVGEPMTKSNRKEETRERESEENFLFDEKVRFPILEKVDLRGPFRFQTIWHGQLAPGSFGGLRDVDLSRCNSLRSIFPPSMMGRLNALETLDIFYCESVEVVFDERGEANVNETHGTSDQNPISVNIQRCPSLKYIFSSPMATRCLQQQLKLLVYSCHAMETIVAKEEGRLESTTPHPKFVFPEPSIVQEVTFNYLTTLRVHECDGLKCLFSSSVPQNFKKLKHLEISNCKIVEQIISTTKQDEEHNIFGELKSLRLEKLPNLARFCTGKSIEFPLLEELYIWECIELGAFVGGPMTKSNRKEETRERESEENFLFDEKVRFPRLEKVDLRGHFRFQTIWQGQLAPGSFGSLRNVYLLECNSLRSIVPPSIMGRLNALESLNILFCESVEVVFDERGEANVNETHGTSDPQLKDGQNPISVDIRDCPSLKYIFSSPMATRCLQQLQKLYVDSCHAMETIVAKEEGRLESTTPHPMFVFPEVKSLTFSHMSTLRSFYPGLHASKWPLLENMTFQSCSKVELLAAELSIVQKRQYAQTNQPFFLINQDSFPVLEQMEVGTTEIFYGQSPAESIFSKLKSIHFNGCQSEEIFWAQVLGGNSIAVGSCPSVRNLELSRMDNLMHLGKEKYSQPIFPNLEFLGVSHCDRLKNLESSAISFQNLTALKVYNCNGLECLIPYSIAKCLVHLTKMEVAYCKSIEVIVASNGDDDAGKNEIAFRQLQQLTLEELPSLQGFSSGNCIAKLPLSLIPYVINCPIELKISPGGVPIPERLKITEDAVFAKKKNRGSCQLSEISPERPAVRLP